MRSRAMRRAAVSYVWDRMKVGLWFVPLVMAVSAVLLSRLLVRLDGYIPNEWLNSSRFFLSGTASEMRTAMIGIAGTILATTGVVFSLLTLPLSTVASQFGSRLLRIFLGDRTTQFVLGIFVGTFCYCLGTALTIPYDLPDAEAPQISTTFGLFLTLLSFASLILLIQHISTMLQAPNIIAAAGAELYNVIGAWSDEEEKEIRKETEELVTRALVEKEAYPLQVTESGYIQIVDPKIILNLSIERDLIVRLMRKPGQFVWSGEIVAHVWPASRVDERMAKHLQHAFQVGNQRTPTQDIEYAVNQLVEIAVRAMSPAINDPFSAMTCLDYLGNCLAIYAGQSEDSPNVYDRDGHLRMIYEPVTFQELLNAAFDMLRHASCDNASVLQHMLKVMEAIGQETKTPEERRLLLRHADLVQEESEAGNLTKQDRQAIHLHSAALQAKLAASA